MEIKIKTEHDFNLEKQMLVHNAKVKIQEEYTQKEKDREIQDRIRRSGMVGESRVRKMTARDGYLQKLLSNSTEAMNFLATSTEYTALLKDLIKQALLKIEEEDVEIICKQIDIPKVKQILPAALSEYTELMKKEAGLTVKVTAKVNEDGARCLRQDSPGGVMVTALRGRIVCDNTLDARLKIAYQELLPRIRQQLFPTT